MHINTYIYIYMYILYSPSLLMINTIHEKNYIYIDIYIMHINTYIYIYVYTI